MLKEKQPKYVYNSAHINVFFLMLLAGQTIPKAYQLATGCYEPRNAYRWLDSAYLKLVEYRALLVDKPIKTILSFKMKSLKFKVVLSTLKALFLKLAHLPCATFQITTRQPFL